MNFAFYITGQSTLLTKYLNQDAAKYEMVKVVVSDKEVPSELKDLIRNRDIVLIEEPYSNIIADGIKQKNLVFSNYLLSVLKEYKIDFCFSFGEHILTGNLLNEYRNKIINFHPAILPMYPGLNAIDQAVKHGNTLLVGNTAHFVDEGMDTGLVIMQSVIPLQTFLDTNDYQSIMGLIIPMLNKLVILLRDNRVQIINNRVVILGADYNQSFMFPAVE